MKQIVVSRTGYFDTEILQVLENFVSSKSFEGENNTIVCFGANYLADSVIEVVDEYCRFHYKS